MKAACFTDLPPAGLRCILAVESNHPGFDLDQEGCSWLRNLTNQGVRRAMVQFPLRSRRVGCGGILRRWIRKHPDRRSATSIHCPIIRTLVDHHQAVEKEKPFMLAEARWADFGARQED